MRPFLVVLTGSAIAAFANAADVSLVGKQVIVTDCGSNFMVAGKVVGAAAKYGIYQVEQVKGEWLWIASHAAYLQRKDVIPLDEAIEYYSRQIEIQPTVHLFEGRAEVWRLQGEYEKAIEDTNEALQFWPTMHALYLRRAYLRCQMKDYHSAIADCDEAIRLAPFDAAAYYARGLVRMDMGKYGLARKDFTTAIRFQDILASRASSEITGQQPYQQNVQATLYHGRAIARRAAERFESALTDEEEAIKRDPKYVAAYGAASEVLVKCPDPSLRDAARAVKLALTACELTNWQNARAINTLAAAYAELGDYDEAIKAQERAIELTDGEEKSRYERGLEEILQRAEQSDRPSSAQ